MSRAQLSTRHAAPAKPAQAHAARPSRADKAQADLLAELRPGQSVVLLQELHILTREGRLNQDSRRKLKQVYHLFQFIEKLLLELPEAGARATLADHGAGKSYLGFIIYDLFFRQREGGHVYGIETRPELVARSRELAQRLGFARMSFLNVSAAEARTAPGLPERIDLVTALHACDTATDDAIAFGLAKNARFMALVPCCQAEVAASLRANKALSLSRTPLAELWRHPLHTREIGSQLTNVLRCLYLEAQGYQVTVTELVGWEHSLKNELIIARHTGHRKASAAARMQELLSQFGLDALGPDRFPLQA
ncbi:SAM-dependent methyltransferase [Variovorax sp.]|uniref:class I SAM-dependent methyltransferase n=1 Tax=Variovorax sp. TaxID=1871043 RepID=UPI002D2EDDFA|nr:SAM-dependent methyltransferase [Variovorax sp.]HYP82372.1 SAM-dependent methyltransferase [Variovorax sp.]